jgi:tetratricopeptide (TPR) repeat protein
VTHEYWDGSDTESLDTIYIDDIGDGGSKADKFPRDERLLRKGLEEEPTNARYMFYLAQTLKDMKKLPEAIELYKRRTEAGGWHEEVWYSMYMIGKLYNELNNKIEMEYWCLKAYEMNKNRSENLYYLAKVFREMGQNHKAWHYVELGSKIKTTKDMLFVETDVYTHLFDYERTILNYYVKPHENKRSLGHLIKYYNKQGGHVYSNLQF